MVERKAEWVLIEPDTARRWLAANGHNRPVMKSHVVALAREIREGRWFPNGEAIKFDRRGTLLDGQHRLHAIVTAGVAVESLVIRGLEPECFSTLDGGTKRTAGHHLAVLGKSDYNTLGGALTLLRRYERGDLTATNATAKTVSGRDVLDTLERHPGMELSVAVGRKVRHLLSGSLAAFFHYVFAQKDRAMADEFFEELALGTNLSATDPVWQLRERLMKDRLSNKASPSRRYVMHLVIKAWNKKRAGEQVRVLRVNEGEAFPNVL